MRRRMDDDDRKRPYLWIVLTLAALWVLWEGALNIGRWGMISSNMASLAPFLEQDSPEQYRDTLLRATAQAGVRPHDLDITFDPVLRQFDVVVRGAWTFEIPGVWQFRSPYARRIQVLKKEVFTDDPLFTAQGV